MFVVVQVVLYLLILSFGVELPRKGLYFRHARTFHHALPHDDGGHQFRFILSAISRSTEMAIYS
jgi:hypothetical protein